MSLDGEGGREGGVTDCQKQTCDRTPTLRPDFLRKDAASNALITPVPFVSTCNDSRWLGTTVVLAQCTRTVRCASTGGKVQTIIKFSIVCRVC